MTFILWLIAVILVIWGIVTLIRGGVLLGIVLIVVGLLVGPRRGEHLQQVVQKGRTTQKNPGPGARGSSFVCDVLRVSTYCGYLVHARPGASDDSAKEERCHASAPSRARTRAGPASGTAAVTATSTSTAPRSRPRTSPASRRSSSRPPGATCGSRRTPTRTCSPSAPTTPDGASTSTTRCGAQKRDEMKFERVLEMATRLPRVRKRIRADLTAGHGLAREAALAAAVRMVDLGCFRLGDDVYTEQNGSYGLTTLERRHVRHTDDGCVFSFVGKAGVEHDITPGRPQPLPRAAPDDPAPRPRRPAAQHQGRPTLGGRAARGHQRAHPRPVRHGRHRQGLPHLARHRARRPASSPVPSRPPARPPGPGPSARRSSVPPSCWATPRPSAGPPTSTLRSSTSTSPAPRSRRPWSGSPRTRTGPATSSTAPWSSC